MEGLIPFVYKAIVQYRSGADVGAALYYAGAAGGGGFAGCESSPARGGAYVRLSSGDSGRFRPQEAIAPPVVVLPGSSPSPSRSGLPRAPVLRRSAKA